MLEVRVIVVIVIFIVIVGIVGIVVVFFFCSCAADDASGFQFWMQDKLLAVQKLGLDLDSDIPLNVQVP